MCLTFLLCKSSACVCVFGVREYDFVVVVVAVVVVVVVLSHLNFYFVEQFFP